MIPHSTSGKLLFYTHIVLVLIVWLIPVAMYQSLPAQVAVHFDSSGMPDQFAEKGGLDFWLIPILATGLGALVLGLMFIPQHYQGVGNEEINTLPADRRLPVYTVLREMMLAIFVGVDLVLVAAVSLFVSSIPKESNPFPIVLIVGFVLVPILPLAYYLPKLSRAIAAAKRG